MVLCFPATLTRAEEEKKLSDEDIAKLIIGKWRFESSPKDPPVKITMTFTKDQKCSTEAESVDLNNKRHKVTASGTWNIEKGDIVVKTEKSTIAKDVGKTNRSKFVKADESTLKVVVTFKPEPGAPGKEFKEVFEFKKSSDWLPPVLPGLSFSNRRTRRYSRPATRRKVHRSSAPCPREPTAEWGVRLVSIFTS
jgi:hypothetical protein